MLRRTQSVAFNLEGEERPDAAPAATSAPETEGPVERRIGAEGIDALRARLQRELAARIDVGDAEPAAAPAPKVERADPPRPERRRIETLRAEAQKSITTAPAPRRLSLLSGRRPGARLGLSRLLLLLVALIAGGAAAWLATRHDIVPPGTRPAAETAAKPAPEVVAEPRVKILVAKQAIAVGQRLADSVDWEDWPQGAMRPEYVANDKAPDAVTGMAGAIARYEIFPGEPIRTDKLAMPGQGYLSAILDSGLRGVSVAVSPEAASGGFIRPDDHVDVVLTRNGDNHTETILHNVRVMAINAQLGNSNAGDNADGGDKPDDKGNAKVFTDRALATLELDPTQAEVIINATAVGKLSLVLRALTDFPKADPGMRPTPNEQIRMTSPFWVK